MNSPKTLLVTGSSGLVGSAVVESFASAGWVVHGVDNNMRRDFFGADGDTRWNLERLRGNCPGFHHHEQDIRDRAGVLALLKQLRPDAIMHAAAQPSHDLAAQRVFDDFDVNASGTLNLLEGARHACPESPFVHMSTNKVYGDAPNDIPLRELPTRYDYDDPAFEDGIPETFRVDQSKHSLFGASKLAADILVQEYGRYFGMPTCALRAGCVTGPNHAGVKLHGFLSYLVQSHVQRREYQVLGFKGKQVRDNIHSEDLAEFIREFIAAPRKAAVYNIGGGRGNSVSLLEAFALVEEISGRPVRHTIHGEARAGDHICYMSDLRKAREHYPAWNIQRDLRATIREIYDSMARRFATA